jgi:hypothetical protein
MYETTAIINGRLKAFPYKPSAANPRPLNIHRVVDQTMNKAENHLTNKINGVTLTLYTI